MSKQIQVRYRQEGKNRYCPKCGIAYAIHDGDGACPLTDEELETIATIKEPSPSVKWALAEIQTLLGKGLYPTAVPKVETVLSQLEQEAYEFGYEQAQYNVGDWNRP